MTSINERLDALMEQVGVDPQDSTVPVAFGTKANVKVGSGGWLGQRFPVTLYGPSWLWLLREENVHAIIDFLEDNVDTISWGK